MILTHGEPGVVLSDERLRASLAIRDWILGEAREIGDPNIILEGVSLMLRDAGVPIDRATSAVELRHAQSAANARIWEFGSSAREYLYAHERGSDASGKRPLAEAHRINDWLFTWLPDTPDDAFDIVAPLKAAGYTHHIAAPVILPNGMHNGFTFATRVPAGFSEQDIVMLRSIFPTLAALQEMLALGRVMREVMRMYVGNEPHLRILSGDVRRGEVLRIRAAILFVDMREFTQLTSHMPEEAATALVNEYYDCIVPPIDERGGEVLKFMGDGILAIFRAGESGDIEACVRAFGAARAGLLRVASRHEASGSAPNFDAASRSISATLLTAMLGLARGSTIRSSAMTKLASRLADLCASSARRCSCRAHSRAACRSMNCAISAVSR
jgi:adenylate cyclase